MICFTYQPDEAAMTARGLRYYNAAMARRTGRVRRALLVSALLFAILLALLLLNGPDYFLCVLIGATAISLLIYARTAKAYAATAANWKASASRKYATVAGLITFEANNEGLRISSADEHHWLRWSRFESYAVLAGFIVLKSLDGQPFVVWEEVAGEAQFRAFAALLEQQGLRQLPDIAV